MSKVRIAQLSDPHFGTILPGVREGLLATLKELSLDLILLTGDITQRARKNQFIEAREFADACKPTPLICVPGNHDIPLFNVFVRLFDPYRGFRKFFKYYQEKDHFQGDVLITGLNSTSRWRHIQGAFNISRIDRRLREKARAAKVHIVAFHHPVDCAKSQDEKNLLCNRDETMDLLDKHNVDLVVGGHIHDPHVALSKTRYPSVKRNMILAVAGTCLSWRTRADAPNSFNLIEVETYDVPQISITRYDQREGLKFSPLSTHQFARGANGWTSIETSASSRQ